jgi:protein MpaA
MQAACPLEASRGLNDQETFSWNADAGGVGRRLNEARPLLFFVALFALWAGAMSHASRRIGTTPASPPPPPRVRTVLGHTARGRPVVAIHLRAAHPRHAALVVGCIHGDEPAGIAVARALAAGDAPGDTDLWVIPDLNPDGVHAGTRVNARHVDLNRNFPWGWRAAGRPGDLQYPGPHPLSEPESLMAHRLVLRVRPHVTIWFHQPLGVTDESGGDPRIERRFAALSGLHLRRLQRYPGSAAGWQDHRLPGTTAFVVELPRGRLSRAQVARFAAAARAVVQD